jgi:RNA polymerase sigma-70 factor (ECF subfamily)
MLEDGDGMLVQRCLSGDKRAFEALVVRYEKPVFNAALRMLRNPEDARDVAQNVFLKVFEHLADYDSKYRFYSWIYRIAVNESLNTLDRRRHHEPIAGDEVDGGIGPEAEVDGLQTSAGIQRALMTIKPEYRAVIVLRHFLDCSYQDMAEVLRLPEKTVKSRLFSARQLLADALRRDGVTGHAG